MLATVVPDDAIAIKEYEALECIARCDSHGTLRLRRNRVGVATADNFATSCDFPHTTKMLRERERHKVGMVAVRGSDRRPALACWTKGVNRSRMAHHPVASSNRG